MCEYEVITGDHVDNDDIEKETMRYLRVLWNSRQRYERLREGWIDCDCEYGNDEDKEMNEDVESK